MNIVQVVDQNETIREFQVNDYEKAFIKKCIIGNLEWIDLRKHVLKPLNNEYVPTKRGFCVRIDDFNRRMLPYILELCGYDPKILNVDKSIQSVNDSQEGQH